MIFKFIVLILLPIELFAHARLSFPVPRNNNSGIKNGPCGGLARSAIPTTVIGGSTITLQWLETIDHPGRYIFSLSLANDQGFNQNVLATIPDLQDGAAGLPHMYTAQLTIPNINCPTCTLQMIQSMEENPAAPTYYYSCADLNIVQAGTTPAPQPAPPSSDEGIQSSIGTSQLEKVNFGSGCGSVVIKTPTALPVERLAWLLLIALLPLLTWIGLISQQRCRQPN